MEIEGRFRDADIEFHGVVGETIEFESANPVNHHQAITNPEGCERITIDAKLFLPHGQRARRRR